MLKKETKSLVKKFIKDSENTEITKHEGNFSPLIWGTAASFASSEIFYKYYIEDFGSVLVLFAGEKGIGFADFKNYKKAAEVTLEKYLKSKEFSEISSYNAFVNKIEKFYYMYNLKKIESLSIKSLEKMVIEIFKILKDLQVITLFCEALDKEVVKKYFDKLNKHRISFEDFFEKASLIDFESFSLHQNKCLVDFSEKREVKNQWVLANYLSVPKISLVESSMKKMVNNLGGIEKIKKEIIGMENQNKKNKLLVKKNKESIPDELKKLYDFIKLSIFLRDTRKEFLFKGSTLLLNFAREIFKKMKLVENNIIFSCEKDFESGLYRDKKYNKLLQKRKKGVAMYFTKEGVKEEFVNFYEAKEKVLSFMDKKIQEEEIKGNVACGGKVKGKAKVVLNNKDFGKFKKGDILITSMTRPEFVPLMKKATAVITDEGGITCHAAIISRELNVPCIIGTKNGSRFIKDGDLVEVDANIGIIKIIK